MNEPKTVLRSHLASWRMVAVGEDIHPIVIDTDGHRKDWVAIGWIDCGPASDADKATYPHVVEDPV